jgi:uncharacterized protein involved in exopolysaccharide biosynthesis
VDGLTPARVTGRGSRLPMVAGYFATLRSHIGAIVALTFVGLIVGAFFSTQVNQSYKANALIALPDVPTYVDLNPDPPAPSRTTIDTTAELLFSQPVYDAVADATQLPEDRVRSGLSVSAYPLSRVLIVTFTARTKDQAVDGANAAAEQLRIERQEELPGAQTDRAEDFVGELTRLREQSQEQVREFTPQTQDLTNQILAVQDSIDAGDDIGGRIINKADPDSAKRVKKHLELQLITWSMIGLLAGIGYSWWRRDKHLHHDPRIIGLAAKVRPRRRSGRRSPLPARGLRRGPSHSHEG